MPPLKPRSCAGPAVVVVDTNVWVSALINPRGAPARIREAFVNNEFEIVVSKPFLEEIAEVLGRPRIRDKYGLNEDTIAEFLDLLAQRGFPVMPTGNLRVCRDPDDDVVLETALLGGAGFMVTRDDDIKRDQDLIAQMEERGIVVLSVQQFLDRLAHGGL